MKPASWGWLLLAIGGLILFLAMFPFFAGEYELMFTYYGSEAITLGGALVFIAIIIFIAVKS